MCAMLLADLGATVLRVERMRASGLGIDKPSRFEIMNRSRHAIAVDLKHRDGVETVLRLAASADAFIEGFRPGVAERLGIGPDACLARNPRLVYGRMTGWGQTGPLAQAAGHDLNYIALTGVLHAIGRAGGAPVPPLNLVGDFGGGGMLLGFGVVCALLEAQRSGRGQVIDAAMVDGAALLAAMFAGFLAAGGWSEARGENILDSGAPWYDVYETADRKYVAIGAIEDKFYAELCQRLQLSDLPAQHDRARWPEMRRRFAETFKKKARDEWCRVFEGSDACFAPVLSWSEARAHEHSRARAAYGELAKVAQPAPAPRFSRTAPRLDRAPPERGEGGRDALRDWGFAADDIARLKTLGIGFL